MKYSIILGALSLLLFSCINGSISHANRNACDIEAIQIFLPDSGHVSIPNIFTPELDGINDIFQITYNLDSSLLENFVLTIDRGLATVFETQDPDFIWDGVREGDRNPTFGIYDVEVSFDYDGVSYGDVGEIALIAPRGTLELGDYRIDCSKCIFPDQIFPEDGSIGISLQPLDNVCE
ncbi:MAG: gliding motility-associated C-terminal domain-containing protein [Bacteroidota bacterium]